MRGGVGWARRRRGGDGDCVCVSGWRVGCSVEWGGVRMRAVGGRVGASGGAVYSISSASRVLP